MSSFYITLGQAREALIKRSSLKTAVQQYWEGKGFSFPEAFVRQEPLGFVSRHIATARYEDLVFILQCESAGLTPAWSTYIEDRFIDRSPVKYSYLQPRVVSGFGKGATPIIRRLNLAQPKMWEGKPLSNIVCETIPQQPTVVSYHASLLKRIYPEAIINDPSAVYKACQGARGYYPLLLSLAIAHGVLFEDFHGGESGAQLNSFTQRVFEPAFFEVQSYFGISPLVVPLPWWKELGYYSCPELASTIPWREHPIVRQQK